MKSLQLEQLKLPWMEVSRKAYPESGVCAMQHLEMYMRDIEKWNTRLRSSMLVHFFFPCYNLVNYIIKSFDKFFALNRHPCWRSPSILSTYQGQRPDGLRV